MEQAKSKIALSLMARTRAFMTLVFRGDQDTVSEPSAAHLHGPDITRAPRTSVQDGFEGMC